MAIKVPDIYTIIEKIGDHYQKNINNRFMRKALLLLELPQSEWNRLDGLTAKSDYNKAQGFQLYELYEMVLAVAHFIYQARQKLIPNLKALFTQRVARESRGPSDKEVILRDMAFRNFPVNLGILSDLINELYLMITSQDSQMHGKKPPIYKQIPELKELGRYLIPS
jgi:hypothetical protein